MLYVYRCTSDKLEHHLNRVVEASKLVEAGAPKDLAAVLAPVVQDIIATEVQ